VNRTIGYDRIDREAARDMFIRCALVEGDWTTHHKFWPKNLRFLKDLAGMGERMRRIDLADPEAVFSFYDRRIGADVTSTRHFDRWWKDARAERPDLLTMRLEDFVSGPGGLSARDFPGTWHVGDMSLTLTYRFDPGDPADGVTVHVPLAALNQVPEEGFDWQVPGFRDDLVAALMKSLPKEHRRELVPMAEVTAKVLGALTVADEPLNVALARAVREVTGVRVPAHAFDVTKVPAHLRVNFAIDDERGDALAVSKSLEELRTALAPKVRAAIARTSPIDERRGITTWDFARA
jgi:ATP-dependent helicase HrpA